MQALGSPPDHSVNSGTCLLIHTAEMTREPVNSVKSSTDNGNKDLRVQKVFPQKQNRGAREEPHETLAQELKMTAGKWDKRREGLGMELFPSLRQRPKQILHFPQIKYVKPLRGSCTDQQGPTPRPPKGKLDACGRAGPQQPHRRG